MLQVGLIRLGRRAVRCRPCYNSDRNGPQASSACFATWCARRERVGRDTHGNILEGRSAAMPTYEYLCQACGTRFEVWQKMSDDALTTCQACGGPVRRVLYPAGIVFKGG